jgi:putative ABC transport system permease protein
MSRWPFLRSLRPGQVRSDPDEDIHEEIELYLDLRAQELEEQGMDPTEARRVARERFGDTDRIERELRRQAKRRHARQGTTMTMSGLKQDLIYALRSFRRNPGFFGVAVVTLALALGGNTAIFSVVDAALLQALPFEDHEELVFVNGYHLVDGQIAVRGASYPEFRDWRGRSQAIESMAAVEGASLTLMGDDSADRAITEIVTEGYFDLLGASPALGRGFTTEEHVETDAHSVVVLSHALWERRFASAPSIVGQDIILNDRPLTVIGVMPDGFVGLNLANGTDLWLPESLMSLDMGADILEARGDRFLTVVGRLAPAADLETAQAELDVVARDLQQDFPNAHEDRFAQVQTFREGYLGDTGGLLWILLGAGGVLLLIAAANVSNLLLVRSHNRTREIVLRRALGAESSRIAAQLLTESVVLATVGGLAGIGVAMWALATLGPMIPNGALPGYVDPALSPTAFVVSLAVLALVGLVTGLVPAIASARLDMAGRLREGGRAGAAGGGFHRFRAQHLFVIAQVALALVLMVGAGLLTRSFRAQLAVDTGSELEGVQAMTVQLPNGRYDSGDVIRAFATELERKVQGIPGVERAALSSDLPFRSGSSGAYIWRPGDGPDDRIRIHRHYVTPTYFETMGIELRAGRYLSDDDVQGSTPSVVVTDALIRRVFPGESGVGQTIWLRPDGTFPVQVVGVIDDVRYRDVTTSLMADANSPDIFFSMWQFPVRGIEVAARAEGGGQMEAVAAGMRGVVQEIDADLPIFLLQPLVESWRAQTATPRFAAFLMSLFSGLATLLACVGIYGVLAFAVGQRSREIAIRRAIGASGGRVARSVVLDGIKLAGFGLLVGAVAAAAGGRVLESFLYGVATTDPLTFITVGGGMVAVAVIAALIPALRATRRQPGEALSAE